LQRLQDLVSNTLAAWNKANAIHDHYALRAFRRPRRGPGRRTPVQGAGHGLAPIHLSPQNPEGWPGHTSTLTAQIPNHRYFAGGLLVDRMKYEYRYRVGNGSSPSDLQFWARHAITVEAVAKAAIPIASVKREAEELLAAAASSGAAFFAGRTRSKAAGQGSSRRPCLATAEAQALSTVRSTHKAYDAGSRAQAAFLWLCPVADSSAPTSVTNWPECLHRLVPMLPCAVRTVGQVRSQCLRGEGQSDRENDTE